MSFRFCSPAEAKVRFSELRLAEEGKQAMREADWSGQGMRGSVLEQLSLEKCPALLC